MEDDRRSAPMEEVRSRFEEYLKDLPTLLSALHGVLDVFEEAAGEPVNMGRFMRGEDSGLAIAALSHLSQGRAPALRMFLTYVDADGVERRLEARDREAAARGEYAHPVTGDRLTLTDADLYPWYEPLPGLLAVPAPAP